MTEETPEKNEKIFEGGQDQKRISAKKIIVIASIIVIGIGLIIISTYPYFICGDTIVKAKLQVIPGAGNGQDRLQETIKVMTLNIAHGRKNGPHQLLQNDNKVKPNLDEIAALLIREEPIIIALQEADGPSFWSGSFDHVQYIAEKAQYPYFIREEQVKGLGLSYGTAIVSRRIPEGLIAYTFPPSLFKPPKGFTKCTIQWPGKPEKKIDVVSVHLEHAAASIREKQARKIIEVISQSSNPLVAMGDFNCEWTGREKTLQILVDELGLKTFDPDADDMATFRSSGKRLDWIFISDELEFVSYRILPDIVSDHYAIIAELKLKKEIATND